MTYFQTHIIEGPRNKKHRVLLLTIPRSYFREDTHQLTLHSNQWALILRSLYALDRYNGYSQISDMFNAQGFVADICMDQLPAGQRLGRFRSKHPYFFKVSKEIKTRAWRKDGDGYSWMPRIEWIEYLFSICRRDTISNIFAEAGFKQKEAEQDAPSNR